jgi:ubiquitin carboxyl-terminal hydrolase 4/11/15
VLAPRELHAMVVRRCPQFAGARQEDAHEVLAAILDCLHADLNTGDPAAPVQRVVAAKEGDAELAARTLAGLAARDKSVITDTFQGLVKCVMRCPACQQSVTFFDPYQTLSVPIPSGQGSQTEKGGYFVFAPFDPLKARRQIPMHRLESASLADAIQAFGRTHGIDNLEVLFAQVDARGGLTWLESARPGKDTTLWLFELPDPLAFYVHLKLVIAKDLSVQFLMQVDPEASPKLIEESVQRYFAYLWDPKGQCDHRPIPAAVVRVQRKLQAATVKGGPRLEITISKPRSKTGNCLSRNKAIPQLAQQKVRVKLNPSYLGAGFNWNRLQPEILPLLLPGGALSEVTLGQCIAEMAREVVLDKANKWDCPNCNQKVCASMVTQLWSTPNVLVVHLQRFQQTLTGIGRKLETNVVFPQELDLEAYALAPGPHRYQLFAVGEHHGLLTTGHYTARVCCQPDGIWYRFNDLTVEQCTPVSAHTYTAYLLFYMKKEPMGRVLPEAKLVDSDGSTDDGQF